MNFQASSAMRRLWLALVVTTTKKRKKKKEQCILKNNSCLISYNINQVQHHFETVVTSPPAPSAHLHSQFKKLSKTPNYPQTPYHSKSTLYQRPRGRRPTSKRRRRQRTLRSTAQIRRTLRTASLGTDRPRPQPQPRRQTTSIARTRRDHRAHLGEVTSRPRGQARVPIRGVPVLEVACQGGKGFGVCELAEDAAWDGGVQLVEEARGWCWEVGWKGSVRCDAGKDVCYGGSVGG